MESPNPVVLIATHQRVDITIENVYNCLNQDAQVWLVCSDNDEFDRFFEVFGDIKKVHITQAPNSPLGGKWQHGVIQAKYIRANPLIITGSDDFLQSGFVQNCMKLIEQGYDFIGSNQFYAHDTVNNVLYKMGYTFPNFPIGGGRAYTYKALKACNFTLFQSRKEKHLDDDGWRMVNRARLKTFLSTDIDSDGLAVLAVKGNWTMLNPTDKLLSRPDRIKVIETYRGIELQNKLKELIDDND